GPSIGPLQLTRDEARRIAAKLPSCRISAALLTMQRHGYSGVSSRSCIWLHLPSGVSLDCRVDAPGGARECAATNLSCAMRPRAASLPGLPTPTGRRARLAQPDRLIEAEPRLSLDRWRRRGRSRLVSQ